MDQKTVQEAQKWHYVRKQTTLIAAAVLKFTTKRIQLSKYGKLFILLILIQTIVAHCRNYGNQ